MMLRTEASSSTTSILSCDISLKLHRAVALFSVIGKVKRGFSTPIFFAIGKELFSGVF
jgi:hypothetical protein